MLTTTTTTTTTKKDQKKSIQQTNIWVLRKSNIKETIDVFFCVYVCCLGLRIRRAIKKQDGEEIWRGIYK